MQIVDASVAVKFVLFEGGAEQARNLLISETPLAAPDWMLLEVAHVIWKFHADGGIAHESAIAANSAMPKFFSALFPAAELLADAISLSYQLDHDVYDCCYLALALRERTSVVTADRKFWNAAKRAKLGDHVVLFEWPGQRA